MGFIWICHDLCKMWRFLFSRLTGELNTQYDQQNLCSKMALENKIQAYYSPVNFYFIWYI